MKIVKVSATNFLKLRDFDVMLDDNIMQLFCGLNEAGKSSFQEAIRFGILGDTVRVSRKSDYGLMVRDGATEAKINIKCEDAVFSRAIKSKGNQANAVQYDTPLGLEYLIDATRFAWIDPKQRREFIFKLLQVKFSRDEIAEKLLRREVPEKVVEQIKPLLRAGFDSACSEASKKATGARSEWKGLTGETYGSDKAIDWKPEVVPIDPKELLAAEKLERSEREVLEEMLGRRGAYIERIKAASNGDPEELPDPGFDPPEGGTKGPVYPEGWNFRCPACEATLNSPKTGVIRLLTPDDLKADPTPAAKKKTKKKAAKKAVPKVSPLHRELDELEVQLEEQRQNHAGARVALDGIIRQHDAYTNAGAITKQAFALHTAVEDWKLAAELLAPTGIPGEIISDQIKPLNDRLRETATTTGWPQVAIQPDLEVTIEGRGYGLQSESAQWRAQVSIAEAISVLSGVGVLVIDRMDVLDLGNRAKLMGWLSKVAPSHNNIIIIGTLKAAPKMPPHVTVHWMDNGELVDG